MGDTRAPLAHDIKIVFRLVTATCIYFESAKYKLWKWVSLAFRSYSEPNNIHSIIFTQPNSYSTLRNGNIIHISIAILPLGLRYF